MENNKIMYVEDMEVMPMGGVLGATPDPAKHCVFKINKDTMTHPAGEEMGLAVYADGHVTAGNTLALVHDTAVKPKKFEDQDVVTVALLKAVLNKMGAADFDVTDADFDD